MKRVEKNQATKQNVYRKRIISKLVLSSSILESSCYRNCRLKISGYTNAACKLRLEKHGTVNFERSHGIHRATQSEPEFNRTPELPFYPYYS
jgi:hypothetical protein